MVRRGRPEEGEAEAGRAPQPHRALRRGGRVARRRARGRDRAQVRLSAFAAARRRDGYFGVVEAPDPEMRRHYLCRCGSAFNAARRRDGSVLTWGLGEVGELGRDACEMKVAGPDGGEPDYDKPAIVRDHLTPGAPRFAGTNEPIEGAKAIGCGAPPTSRRAYGSVTPSWFRRPPPPTHS